MDLHRGLRRSHRRYSRKLFGDRDLNDRTGILFITQLRRLQAEKSCGVEIEAFKIDNRDIFTENNGRDFVNQIAAA